MTRTGALVSLPVAVETGVYPRGLVGFVAAVYFGARLFRAVGKQVGARIVTILNGDDTSEPPKEALSGGRAAAARTVQGLSARVHAGTTPPGSDSRER